MRTRTILLALSMLLLSGPLLALTIDSFEQYDLGSFPKSWRTWPFQRGKAMEVYKVDEENGNKFLRAFDDKDLSVQILKDFYWKIGTYPVLSWKWRARVLPEGANEMNSDLNDSACGVYVVISKARQEMIKYTWSTTAPVGSFRAKVEDKAFIIVLDSGKGKLGQWQKHSVNVLEEYKKYFKRDLEKEPVAIAILTDGNAMHKASACDYDDFAIEELNK